MITWRHIGTGDTRRERLVSAMTALQEYEQRLSVRLLTGLAQVPGVRVYGLTDPARAAERVPTVAFTKAGETPRTTCERLAKANINSWSGNYYAVQVMERLGLKDGAVRVGLAHYNTPDEIDRFLTALAG